MKKGAFYTLKSGLVIFFALLSLSWASKAKAQSTSFDVKLTGYTISVNGKPVDFNVYTIHNSPYCRIEDLAKSMSGVFDVQQKTDKNLDETEFPVFRITTGKEQSGSGTKSDGKSSKAHSVYAHLFVDNQRCPTTPYKINGNYFFKMADILRVLNIQLIVNHTKHTIEIESDKPYLMPPPSIPQSSSAPKKWTRVPANIAVAVSQLNGYFDGNSSSVLFNHTVADHLSANALVIVHIPTGRRIELPFDEKENSYGGIFRGFSEGWVQVIARVGEERLFTYVNALGEVINPRMLFTSARAFENGHAFVTYKENGVDYSGVINHNGEVIVAVAGKYENAQFGNGVFGFETFLKRGHNTFYDVHYFGYDGKRINLPLDRAKELESPGYKTAEAEKFEIHRKNYGKSRYCGYNRFIVEKNGRVIIVDSDNKTIFETESGMDFLVPLFAWGKLFFRSEGIKDHNGRQIIEKGYEVIEPVDGEAFLVIAGNKVQKLIGLDGKILASSSNPSLWALSNSVLITNKVYHFKTEILPGDVVMIYSNMDLGKSISTAKLKSLVTSRPHTSRWLKPTHPEAQRLVQNPSANGLHVIALEALYQNWFSTTSLEE